MKFSRDQKDREMLRLQDHPRPLRIPCKTCPLVGRSRRLVQIRPMTSAGFYENAAFHGMESPAASMIASITSRNIPGSGRSTKRRSAEALVNIIEPGNSHRRRGRYSSGKPREHVVGALDQRSGDLPPSGALRD
jgi:hypothetical protein